MVTLLRRVFWLAVVGAAGFAGWSAWSRRKSSVAAGPPEWPPIEPRAAAPTVTEKPATEIHPAAEFESAASLITEPADTDPIETTGTGPLTWVAPDAGSCPASHPIKANSNSGIFHMPGGRFYNQTRAERCYGEAEDAEADGYRRAKS